MSGSDNFLSRWTRLKREAQQAKETPPVAAEPDKPAGVARPEAAPAEFDPASLPSLDAITASTDIRAFLAPGVPAELTRAALRRVWVADPAIRDYIGLAENQWDFTAPDSMAGFGPLRSGDDVAKMVAEVFKGTGPQPAESTKGHPGESEQLNRDADAFAKTAEVDATKVVDDSEGIPAVPVKLDVATQQTSETTKVDLSPAKQNPPDIAVRRRHGGALPH